MTACALCKSEAGPFRTLSSSDEVVCLGHDACRVRRRTREIHYAAIAEVERNAALARRCRELVAREAGR